MAYTDRQIRIGIFCACVIGVLMTVFAMTVGLFLENTVIGAFGGTSKPELSFDQMQGMLAIAALLVLGGLPLGLIVGGPAGYLVVRWFNLRTEARIWRFTLAGGVAAFVLGMLAIAFYAMIPFGAIDGPGATSAVERWGRVTDLNGVKTAFGWAIEAYLTARFVLIGCIAGLSARLIMGPPRVAV